jgi:hypothetical protein
MSLAFRVTPSLFLLFMGCYPGADWGSDEVPIDPVRTVTGYQKLRTTRQAGSAPATVQAAFELNDAAVAGLQWLDVSINVYSGESLDGQGLRAQWLGGPGGEPVHASFAGELSTTWSAGFAVASSFCAAGPCELRLELAPEGEWRSELSFPLEYEVYATLDLQGPSRFDASMQLTLEERP